MKSRGIVGILGHGEIGSAMARICKKGGYKVLIRELKYDQLAGQKVDYLHVNIPEKSSSKFVNIVSKNIKELKPKLTVINSSTTPGTTRKIYKRTNALVVHSPVVGLHPNLYYSIKHAFPKIIGPTSKESLNKAKKHFKDLGLQIEVYDSSDESETAKLLDLVYYAWNIIFCKWIYEVSKKLKLNFDHIYTKHTEIYNRGYEKLLPNVVRPILKPAPGPIGGHCTIPDTALFDKYFPNRFTRFILKENKSYEREVDDIEAARKRFIKQRDKYIKTISHGKKKSKKSS